MNITKKIMLGINIFSIIIIFYHNYIYQSTGYKMELKVTCSAMFAVLGLINLLFSIITKQSNIKYYICMSLGLILACLGDYLILFNFIKGAVSFALGHICFIIAYCFLKKINKWDLLISSVIFVGCLIFLLFHPLLKFDNPLFQIVCIIYSLIISLMVGKAVGNLIQDRNIATITIALSSLLFFFSDLMLVLGWFVKTIEWADDVCLATYYPALSLLAFSMLLIYLIKTKNEEQKSNYI